MTIPGNDYIELDTCECMSEDDRVRMLIHNLVCPFQADGTCPGRRCVYWAKEVA